MLECIKLQRATADKTANGEHIIMLLPFILEDGMSDTNEINNMFGRVFFINNDYEVRIIEREDGLHVYGFRCVDGETQLPHAFLMGHNTLFFPRREVK
jgi:hypothetical protein